MEYIIIVFCGAVTAVVLSFYIMYRTDKKQKAERLQIQRKPYEMLVADFARVGWGTWGYASHRADGQYARIQRAIKSEKMKLVHYDPITHTAYVQGEHEEAYEITPQGCSCEDFRMRHLPCKHMYFAVMEIPDKK